MLLNSGNGYAVCSLRGGGPVNLSLVLPSHHFLVLIYNRKQIITFQIVCSHKNTQEKFLMQMVGYLSRLLTVGYILLHNEILFHYVIHLSVIHCTAYPGGHAASDVGLQLLDC
jgi:hypothetical protein